MFCRRPSSQFGIFYLIAMAISLNLTVKINWCTVFIIQFRTLLLGKGIIILLFIFITFLRILKPERGWEDNYESMDA